MTLDLSAVTDSLIGLVKKQWATAPIWAEIGGSPPGPTFTPPQFCMPVIAGAWTPGSAKVTIGGVLALEDSSQCECSWGGTITVSSPGQESTTVQVERGSPVAGIAHVARRAPDHRPAPTPAAGPGSRWRCIVMPVGSWGGASFENDLAGDWFLRVEEAPDPGAVARREYVGGLDIPAVSVSAQQVGEYVGFLGGFWGFDGPASAQITRDLLGWEPTRPGLIADLEEGHYFT